MDEARPLLHSPRGSIHDDGPHESHSWIRHDEWRRHTRGFLSSKLGHYLVLLLVSLDVTGIFLDFLLKLYICDHTCGKDETASKEVLEAVSALGVISLVFSCLFMVELLASIWAFGPPFFKSWFRCLDATVIVVGLIIDISLSGVEEEAGSIIVVLRFWRVIKIIEELSAGASEQMDELKERLESLQVREIALQEQIADLKAHR